RILEPTACDDIQNSTISNTTHTHQSEPNSNLTLIPSNQTALVSANDLANQTDSKDHMLPPTDFTGMIMARCQMKANRYITLLNQQDIEGVIKMWQRRDQANPPLYMQVRLRGFKVSKGSNGTGCHESTAGADSRNQTDGSCSSPPVEASANQIGRAHV